MQSRRAAPALLLRPGRLAAVWQARSSPRDVLTLDKALEGGWWELHARYLGVQRDLGLVSGL